MMTTKQKVPGLPLHTLEGISAYVQNELAAAIQRSTLTNGRIPRLGIVIGKGAYPVYRAFGGNGESKAKLTRILRRVAMTMPAEGVLFIRAEEGQVLVTLEHRTHGHHRWQSSAVEVQTPFGVPMQAMGPIGRMLRAYEDQQTRFLPERWRN